MSGVPWTDKEIEILKEMAQKGFRVQDIQKVLKSRSINGIRNKALLLNLSLMGERPEIDFEAFRQMMAIKN